jgi:diaminohydroxyphosphoribosylaminopyrimidine deaminase/5-amino-6-(5-phosphoribosylamino)uracil reductase
MEVFSNDCVNKMALTTPDEFFMKRAFELAYLGVGEVSPNPRVGCVIVLEGKIIGEGWHRKFGGPHAEVNAVHAVSDEAMLNGATVYVNLEPCSHLGKTPPCTDLLIKHGVKKVVVANEDTNPLVSGRGMKKLLDAGIEVVSGVLAQDGRQLNRRFFTFVEKRRPYIILKWAETADGFIARTDFDSKWISNAYSRQLVHQWRSQEDAVLVGGKTAAHDNPRLSVRDWSGRNPVRLVIDAQLRLPGDLHLFDQSQTTYCYNLLQREEQENLVFVKLQEEDFLSQLVNDAYEKNIQSVIVEGGQKTLDRFIRSGLWDEARVFRSSYSIGSGINAPRITGELISREEISDDLLEIFYHGKN